jgi:hypothetical protein
VVLAIVGVGWGRLEARDFSGPNCIPPATWTWMDNAKSMNPCKTAAVLQGACHGTSECDILYCNTDVECCTQPFRSLHSKVIHTTPQEMRQPRTVAIGVPVSYIPHKSLMFFFSSWATYNLLSACTLCQDEQNGVLSYVNSRTVPKKPLYNSFPPLQLGSMELYRLRKIDINIRVECFVLPCLIECLQECIQPLATWI